MIFDCLTDALMDTAGLLPFLFVTYLIMEWLEKKTRRQELASLARFARWGPLPGGLLGIIPQCGFSAAAASLFAGGVITAGTLLAVFLSTSDEMLIIMAGSHFPVSGILRIVAVKAVIAVITGLAVDLCLKVFKKTDYKKDIHDLCEAEQCGCAEEDGNIFKAALVHTVHIALFVFIISFALTSLIESVGIDKLSGFIGTSGILAVALTGLVGLIPNCASSVAITRLYIGGLIGAGPMIAGSLTAAGVGLLVLFRTNLRPKENILVTVALFIFGICWGMVIEALHIIF